MMLSSKTILALLVSLTVVFVLTTPSLAENGPPDPEMPSAGTGTINNPYEIETLENLYWIAEDPDRWSKHYIQTASISFPENAGSWDNDQGWKPIGNSDIPFNGSYDGGGYTITNLVINRPGQNNVGLFGLVGSSTAGTAPEGAVTIKNLGLIDATVSGGIAAGTLIGRVIGDINTVVENCFADSDAIRSEVTGDRATGGLIGTFNSYQENPAQAANFRPTLRRSYADVDVYYSGNIIGSNGEPFNQKFGGLVGCCQKGFVSNSYARGTVDVETNSNMGGETSRVGGLTGCIFLQGRIVNSYSTGEVLGDHIYDSRIGGAVGFTGSGNQVGTWEALFWDKQTSNRDDSAAGTGKTTTEMNNISTFTNAGWDITQANASNGTSIWLIDSSINDGYPYLRGIVPGEPGEPGEPEAARLNIETEPAGGKSGEKLATQPVIRIEDAAGDLVADDQSTVVSRELLVLVTDNSEYILVPPGENGTAPAELSGSTEETASGGIVTFTDLALTGDLEAEYVLRFYSTGLDFVNSKPFSLAPPATASSTFYSSGEALPTINPVLYEVRSSTLWVEVFIEASPETGKPLVSCHLKAFNLADNPAPSGLDLGSADFTFAVAEGSNMASLQLEQPLQLQHAFTVYAKLLAEED